jgi:hypothetical protein
MKKWMLAAVVLVSLAGGAGADTAPGKGATVGGGIPNPWRNPFRTAMLEQVNIGTRN